MEKHILFVLGVVIFAYVGMGGLLFQRVEQPSKSSSEKLEPIAVLNVSDALVERPPSTTAEPVTAAIETTAAITTIGAGVVSISEAATTTATTTTVAAAASSSSSTTAASSTTLVPTDEESPTTVAEITSAALIYLAKRDAAANGGNNNNNNNCPISPEQLRIFTLEIAKFVIANVAPRSARNIPQFNASIVVSPTNELQLFITKASQALEDWDFYGSMFFAATTITTIGYGHIAPRTELGKVATVLYALIGIPLVAAFLGGLSDRIRRLAEQLQDRVPVGNGNSKPSRGGTCCFCCVAMLKVLLVSLIGTTVFIVLPSLLFTWKEESWSYIEALYYSFVTLSTIGFGDYIAAHNPELEGLDWYRIFVIVWIFFGLAWLSSVIALIQAAITTYSAIVVKRAIDSKPNENNNNNNNNNHKAYTVEAGLEEHRRKASLVNYDCSSFNSWDDLVSPSMYQRVPRHLQQSQRRRARSSRSLLGGGTVVSVAAAATTTHGDKLTAVSVLPQMLQMAIAANAAVAGTSGNGGEQDSADDAHETTRMLKAQRKPRSTSRLTHHTQESEYTGFPSAAVRTPQRTPNLRPPHAAVRQPQYEETAIDAVDDESGDFMGEESPLTSHHNNTTGAGGGGGMGAPSGSALPSFVEDQRFRRTKMAIHSSLVGSNSKQDSGENNSSSAASRYRSNERQSHL